MAQNYPQSTGGNKPHKTASESMSRMLVGHVLNSTDADGILERLAAGTSGPLAAILQTVREGFTTLSQQAQAEIALLP